MNHKFDLSSKSNNNSRLWIGILFFLIISGEVYLPIITQEFCNWDDPKHIRAVWKPSWERAYRIITDFDLKYTNVTYYSPIHFLSLMADQSLLPHAVTPQPWIAKAMNVFFHMLNAVLVFYLMLHLGIGKQSALIGSLIFAIHPFQVGTVAWIAERKNLLAAFFYLLGLISFIKYLKLGKSTHLFLVGLFFVAGLLSKPTAIMFPLTALLLILVIRPEQRSDQGVLIFLLILTGTSFGWGLYVMAGEVSHPGTLPGWMYRPLIAAGAVFFYTTKFILPLDLVPIYPRWDVLNEVGWFSLILIGMVVCFIGIIYYARQIDRIILWGILFFLVNILPVCGIVPFGYMGHSFVADHFTYLPLIGLSLVLARSAEMLFVRFQAQKVKIHILLVAIYAVIAIWGIMSIKQTLLWRDPTALWEATLRVNQTSPAAYCNYGSVLMNKGEIEKALLSFEKAIELAPGLDIVYYNLGQIHQLLGDRQNAREFFEATLALNPNNVQPHISLARILREEDRENEAMELLNKAIAMHPKSEVLRNELGVSFLNLNLETDALAEFDKALSLEPLFAEPYINKGIVSLRHGKIEQAIKLLEKAVSIDSSARAFDVLGTAYLQAGLPEKALSAFLNAFEVDPRIPGIRDKIANLLLDLGDFQDAQNFCSDVGISGFPCSEATRSRIQVINNKENYPIENYPSNFAF